VRRKLFLCCNERPRASLADPFDPFVVDESPPGDVVPEVVALLVSSGETGTSVPLEAVLRRENFYTPVRHTVVQKPP
jgi:hypothetical protein